MQKQLHHNSEQFYCIIYTLFDKIHASIDFFFIFHAKMEEILSCLKFDISTQLKAIQAEWETVNKQRIRETNKVDVTLTTTSTYIKSFARSVGLTWRFVKLVNYNYWGCNARDMLKIQQMCFKICSVLYSCRFCTLYTLIWYLINWNF